MTRVTHSLRLQLKREIMANLPTKNYAADIYKVIQDVSVEHMPPEVLVVYNNPVTRVYLNHAYVTVRYGNKSVNTYWDGEDHSYVYGLTDRINIQMMDVGRNDRLAEGSIYKGLVVALEKSGLVGAYFDQQDLRKSVSDRLEANLDASKTFKQLYQNLEPELHHYIPKDEAKAQLPACVAPIVDDLRKLGAELPNVKALQ
jgi:hypothetical protein